MVGGDDAEAAARHVFQGPTPEPATEADRSCGRRSVGRPSPAQSPPTPQLAVADHRVEKLAHSSPGEGVPHQLLGPSSIRTSTMCAIGHPTPYRLPAERSGPIREKRRLPGSGGPNPCRQVPNMVAEPALGYRCDLVHHEPRGGAQAVVLVGLDGETQERRLCCIPW